MSLKEIKPKSASMRKKENKIKTSLTDPYSNSFFKRNVPNIIANLKEKFKQKKSVEAHVHSVLANSTVGRLLSVGLQILPVTASFF